MEKTLKEWNRVYDVIFNHAVEQKIELRKSYEDMRKITNKIIGAERSDLM